MQVLSVTEMQRSDAETITAIGIPAMALMERAAWAAFQLIGHCWPAILSDRQPVLLLAGSGNNGGDALALARMLHLGGVPVRLHALPAHAAEARAQTTILDRLGVPVQPLQAGSAALASDLAACALIVDGLFGIGLNRELAADLQAVLQAVNAAGTACLALDIPSGLDGNRGMPLPTAIVAARTVTFGWPKAGLLTDAAADHVGELWVADIGLPAILAADGRRQVTDPARCRSRLTALNHRRQDSHKGDFGRVLLMGGSPTMPGALLMSTAAALAGGPGYVTVALPETLIPTAATRFPAAMFQPLPGAGQAQVGDLLGRASVVAIGPGLGQSPAAGHLVEQVLADATIPVILDADGLNVIAAHPDWVRQRPAPTILTPHAGEAARWLGVSTDEVQADRWGALDQLIALTGATVVLKGCRTLIGAPDGSRHVNVSGSPALARGGSGDVLTGLIAALAAQGLTPTEAARTAVWWHGAAAATAVSAHGTLGATWERVIEALPAALTAAPPVSVIPGLTRLV
jgi:NAD(P)H-hydrate epimerase